MEIIRIAGGDYERYQSLLFKREALKKEAFQIRNAYIREFGEILIQIHCELMECTAIHKRLTIIQVAANYGYGISEDYIEQELEKQMKPYYEELEIRKKELEQAKSCGEISHTQMIAVKHIYRSIAKLIHPDICPLTQENETLGELWHVTQVAYNCNDLELLEETQVLVKKVLEENGAGDMGVVIPDIEKKIEKVEKEIEQIVSTDPYTWSELLNDPEAMRKKKEENAEKLEGIRNLKKEYEKLYNEIMENYGERENDSADN